MHQIHPLPDKVATNGGSALFFARNSL